MDMQKQVENGRLVERRIKIIKYLLYFVFVIVLVTILSVIL